jgi:soluble cytochrome b562
MLGFTQKSQAKNTLIIEDAMKGKSIKLANQMRYFSEDVKEFTENINKIDELNKFIQNGKVKEVTKIASKFINDLDESFTKNYNVFLYSSIIKKRYIHRLAKLNKELKDLIKIEHEYPSELQTLQINLNIISKTLHQFKDIFVKLINEIKIIRKMGRDILRNREKFRDTSYNTDYALFHEIRQYSEILRRDIKVELSEEKTIFDEPEKIEKLVNNFKEVKDKSSRTIKKYQEKINKEIKVLNERLKIEEDSLNQEIDAFNIIEKHAIQIYFRLLAHCPHMKFYEELVSNNSNNIKEFTNNKDMKNVENIILRLKAMHFPDMNSGNEIIRKYNKLIKNLQKHDKIYKYMEEWMFNQIQDEHLIEQYRELEQGIVQEQNKITKLAS